MRFSRTGFTLLEIMMAISVSTFVAAIGFTGVNTFGRSITRAKQFASQTEMITGLMRQAIARGDQGQTTITAAPGTALPMPKNWTKCVPESYSAKFFLELKVTGSGPSATTAQTTGDVRKALQMTTDGNGSYNTLQLKTIACFP